MDVVPRRVCQPAVAAWGLGIVILRRRDEAVPEALQRVSLRDLVTLPGTESGVTQLARHRAG
jgi:hypothetical protein